MTLAWINDQGNVPAPVAGQIDDASRLNATRVAEVWPVPTDPARMEVQLREVLRRANGEHKHVSIAGTRHTMGGHAFYPDAIVLDMLPFNGMSLDIKRSLLTVGAGARWSQVIPYLDAHGMSVAVMQSNNDFSVGGSVSVNCHGWQTGRPPISSTVESLRLMKSDGEIVRCSREENRDLFALALGGYGLFGVILDLDLRVVPNERYTTIVEQIQIEDYPARFASVVGGQRDVRMAYGRLCVVPGEGTFLRSAILTAFRASPCKPDDIPKLSEPSLTTLRREIFRAQIGSDEGKATRWAAELRFGEQLGSKYVSRNELLNESSDIYSERRPDRSDILHEYFIPMSRLPEFIAHARAIIPRHRIDLLNITIRDVRTDGDTFLRYADQDMFATVMLFNQLHAQADEAEMQAATRELIDAALSLDGRYYLPYRLHATPEQFARAYPNAKAFFAIKTKLDPGDLFQNQWYAKYKAVEAR